MKGAIDFEKNLSRGKPDEMDVINFRDNTMVCGCTTRITLIYGVIELNYGIWLEYCKDCVCDLLQILHLWMSPV